MEIELQEIAEFIHSIPPFQNLPDDSIVRITQNISIRYIRRDAAMPPSDVTEKRYYILRTGAMSMYSDQDKLLGKLDEGDICTSFCLHSATQGFYIRVDEDTLIYTISCSTLNRILADFTDVKAYLEQSTSMRLNPNIGKIQQKNDFNTALMQTPVSEIMQKATCTAETTISIRDAAVMMAENNISSLVLTQQQKPLGIVTDKDISKRCVAGGLAVEQPVADIMSADIKSVAGDTDAFEAMMVMTRNNIRHLPIIEHNQLQGIIGISDILRLEGKNSLYLSTAIKKCQTVAELQQQSQQLPQLLLQLVKMGSSSDQVYKITTAVTSAITRKLLQMAEQKLGPAPAAYAWVAAGSHARREQGAHSDQDNALIIADDVTAQDQIWYTELARFVCDGLAQCGYVYCPGEVMAINQRWRQPLAKWHEYFYNWITTPSPKALMYSSIFFDLRTVYGDQSLLNQIRSRMLQLTPKNQLFLSHLAFNALKLKPPLGFFRDFVLVHDGKHNDTLDLKHNGLAPIVDLARIYSLAEGIEPINTNERLRALRGSRSLSKEAADDLLDAFEFISALRLEHQADQIAAGLEADNYLSPSAISKLERTHLKDTFKVIQSLQSYLEMKFKIA